MYKTPIRYALAVGLGLAGFTAAVAPVEAQGQAAGLEEVFVTARKRDEGVQAVPISISALSATALEQRNVREIQDLNAVVPGFRFGAQGGKGTNDIVMRGLSRIALGEGVMAVVPYFANVALPGSGSNVPTYDIANVQVLKGPQGTLFGRNTLGGAVVITPEAPDYEFGGYLRGAYGTKDYRVVEGAVNVPIVDDKVALRVAGQIRRQDGMNRNLSGGPDFDNIHQNSYRISLLLQPTEWLENTTVYDHFTAKEQPAALYILRINEDTLNAIAGAFDGQIPGSGSQIISQFEDYAARSRQAGIHASYTDIADGGQADRNLWGISNDTSVNLGGATLRNILGYRSVKVTQVIDTAGTGPMQLAVPTGLPAPFPSIVDFPFIPFNAATTVERGYLSDELQLFGTGFDDRLEWIMGAYYNRDKSTGPGGSTFTAFYPVTPFSPPITPVTAHVTNTNKAVFAQTTLDISDWTFDGLKITTGARRSWDEVWACGGGDVEGYMSEGTCESRANANDPNDGIGVIKNNGAEWTWTLGLDWQINPETMVYLQRRHGYRGVNVNTPLFETPFTTGAVTGCTFGACPDLRPFQKIGPEKLTDIELGLKNDWRLGDVKGRMNVAAFQSKYTDAVTFFTAQFAGIPTGTPDNPTNGSVGANAADLTITGVEADLTVVPVDSLTLTFSGAYTDTQVDKVGSSSLGVPLKKGDITKMSPSFSGTFGFSWIAPLRPLDGELTLSGDYYHTGDFGGQLGENLPGYDITNLRLNWSGIAKAGVDVAIYVKNAFDEEYFSSASVISTIFPVATVMPGDPRTWGLEATYRF